MERLSRTIKPAPSRPIKVVQFGEGNFLRAFIEPFIQTLNEKGLFDGNVAVVQPMPFGRVKDLEEQEGLYTLILEGLDQGEVINQNRLIDVISGFYDPFKDYEGYLNLAKDPNITTIISNTTEAGIQFLEEKVSTKITPTSFPGKLLMFLKTRYDVLGQKASLDIIPCELIDYNGKTLRSVLIELANYNGFDQAFINWMSESNRYYNTLVDRIVPGFPRENHSALEEKFGYLDHSMVKGEIFHLWVIEGPKGLNERLPFDQAGLNVYFVDDFKPYKERKVKILNGSHTAMVPVAYLSGIDTVKESVNDPLVGKFIRSYIFDEVIPTINLPKEDMDKFANSVLERYLNPFVRHELMSIALNSMSKYKSRILPTVEETLEKGSMPKCALFSLASLLVFYRGKRNDEIIKIQDDQVFIDLFNELWANGDVTNLVKTVLSSKHFDSSWLENEKVVHFVTSSVQDILTLGMREALKKMMEV